MILADRERILELECRLAVYSHRIATLTAFVEQLGALREEHGLVVLHGIARPWFEAAQKYVKTLAPEEVGHVHGG